MIVYTTILKYGVEYIRYHLLATFVKLAPAAAATTPSLGPSRCAVYKCRVSRVSCVHASITSSKNSDCAEQQALEATCTSQF